MNGELYELDANVGICHWHERRYMNGRDSCQGTVDEARSHRVLKMEG